MSEASWTTARRQLVRLALLTAGLAPIVALVLIGLIRLQHDTPEWVYWKAELIFLTVLEMRLRRDGVRFPCWARSCSVFCCSVDEAREQPACAGPRAHCCASPSCAAWPWPRRSARAGSPGPIAPRPCPSAASESTNALTRPCGSHTPFSKSISARISPTLPVTTRSIWSSWGDRALREFPTTAGCRSARSSPGSFKKRFPARPIHLNVIARAGDTLEMQHKILSNLRRRPDLLIIYSGHNEFYSRLWWARNIDHYVSDKRPARWAVLVEQARAVFAALRLDPRISRSMPNRAAASG